MSEASEKVVKEAQWRLLRGGDTLLGMGGLSSDVKQRLAQVPEQELYHELLDRFYVVGVKNIQRIRAATALSAVYLGLEALRMVSRPASPCLMRIDYDRQCVEVCREDRPSELVPFSYFAEEIAGRIGLNPDDCMTICKKILMLLCTGFLSLQEYKTEVVLVPRTSK